MKDSPEASESILRFLQSLDLPISLDDPEMLDTPKRTADMFQKELLDGYQRDPAEILSQSFVSKDSNLVCLGGIDFHAVCPHHLIPFFGITYIAYLPMDRVVGFSQIIDLVDTLSHRLILQEQLGSQIVSQIVEHLETPFAACMIQASQLCMMVRGAKRPRSFVTTYAFSGARAGDPTLKKLFLRSFSEKDKLR